MQTLELGSQLVIAEGIITLIMLTLAILSAVSRKSPQVVILALERNSSIKRIPILYPLHVCMLREVHVDHLTLEI